MLAKIGRRRVATGANHPASHSWAFRRWSGTPAGTPTGDQSTVCMLHRNPPLYVKTGLPVAARRGVFLTRGTGPPSPGVVDSPGLPVVLDPPVAVYAVRLSLRALIGGIATGRAVGRRQVRLVGTETLGVAGLAAAVGEHDSEIRDRNGANRGDGGQPASALGEHDHGDHEAHHPDRHHDQVPALAVADVR